MKKLLFITALVLTVASVFTLAAFPAAAACEHEYVAEIKAIANGDAEDSAKVVCSKCGEVLSSMQFDANGPVIFITHDVAMTDENKNTNKGFSPEYPTGLIGDAVATIAAYKKGGTLVFVGKGTPGTYTCDVGGPLLITTTYGGVDYHATKGAYLQVQANLMFTDTLTLKDLYMVTTNGNKYIYLNGNDLNVINVKTCVSKTDDTEATLGRTLIVAGSEVPDTTIGMDADYSKSGINQKINIDSGTWLGVVGGNLRKASGSAFGTLDGNIEINITGGIFENSYTSAIGNDFLSMTGMNNFTGSSTLNISGGSFSGMAIYGQGRNGGMSTALAAPTSSATLTLNISGGEFAAVPIASYNTMNDAYAPTGKFIVNITGGSGINTADGAMSAGGESAFSSTVTTITSTNFGSGSGAVPATDAPATTETPAETAAPFTGDGTTVIFAAIATISLLAAYMIIKRKSTNA